jgi:hypothetical protein
MKPTVYIHRVYAVRSDGPHIMSPGVIINNKITVNIDTTTTTILTILKLVTVASIELRVDID